MSDEGNSERDAAERARLVQRLEWLAWLLDTALPVPFTRARIGLDALIGLIPGIGDAAGAVLSVSIIIGAWRLGVPWHRLTPMAGRVLLETLLGTVPVAGDLFDAGYKANRRNVQTLLDVLADTPQQAPRRWSALLVMTCALFVGIALGLTLLLTAVLWQVVTALAG